MDQLYMPVYRVFNLVRQMGLEPTRSRTRPSNVPVCRFQHCRIRWNKTSLREIWLTCHSATKMVMSTKSRKNSPLF